MHMPGGTYVCVCVCAHQCRAVSVPGTLEHPSVGQHRSLPLSICPGLMGVQLRCPGMNSSAHPAAVPCASGHQQRLCLQALLCHLLCSHLDAPICIPCSLPIPNTEHVLHAGTDLQQVERVLGARFPGRSRAGRSQSPSPTEPWCCFPSFPATAQPNPLFVPGRGWWELRREGL